MGGRVAAQDVAGLLDAGLSISEVAARLGCSVRTVRNRIIEAGLASPTRRHHDTVVALLADAGWLREQYNNLDRSMGDIADQIGVNRATVRGGWTRPASTYVTRGRPPTCGCVAGMAASTSR